MESWLAVVVFSVGLLAYQTHALPRGSDDVGENVEIIKPEDLVIKPPTPSTVIKRSSDDLGESADEELKKIPKPEDIKLKTPLAPAPEKIDEKEAAVEKEAKSKTTQSSTGAKIKVRFPEDSTQALSPKEEDDNVRSKKSPSMRDVYGGPPPHPHTTTVCIQVRSDHQPQVVCGPQVSDEKKESKPSARYAYPVPFEYYPRFAQQEYPPTPTKQIVRFSTQDPNQIPARASGPQYKFAQENPPSTPPKAAAARGPISMYPMRRSEEDPKTIAPVEPVAPIRVIPQPAPAPVLVHKQYYQAVPIQQGFASPLRLNCALQPEGGQFVQPYAGPVLRSASPTFFPFGEQVVTVPEGQPPVISVGPQPLDPGYYLDPQARQAQPDQIIGSPYTPEFPGDQYFLGDDGQTYLMNEARAAEPYLMAKESSTDMDELKDKADQHDRRLSKLQQQLKEMQEKAGKEEKTEKADHHHAEISKDPAEPSADPQVPKKPENPMKSMKRQAQSIR